MQVQKTPKMKEVDQTVYTTYATYFSNLKMAPSTLSSADQLELDIIQLEAEIATMNEELTAIDTDDLLHLYEVRFDQDWKLFGFTNHTLLQYSTFDHTIKAKNSSYPDVQILGVQGLDEGEVETNEDKEQLAIVLVHGKEADGSVIDEVRALHSGVTIYEDSETQVSKVEEVRKCWRVKFERRSYKKGFYHAVLSIKSCNKHRVMINILKQDIHVLKGQLKKLKREMSGRLIELEQQGVTATRAMNHKEFESRRHRLSVSRKMIDATRGEEHGLDVFIELALSGVYSKPSIRDSANALERFWAARLEFDPDNHSTYCGEQ
ncbi:hypothetical protein EC991_005091 [Linnemannia zychae]|nr:hypothetical protein EC991_005091 [Linnemannia zychae]